jgi:hypothetical protein
MKQLLQRWNWKLMVIFLSLVTLISVAFTGWLPRLLTVVTLTQLLLILICLLPCLAPVAFLRRRNRQ